MPASRPGSVTAAAVMAIIYGSLFSLCGLCGLAGLAGQGGKNLFAGGDPNQAQLQKQLENTLERDVPGYRAFQTVGIILNLAESLSLLIGGIGLLSMGSWARILTLVVSVIAIVSTTLQAVYQVALVLPAMNNAFQVVLPAALAQGGGPQGADALRVMQMMVTVIAIVTAVVFLLVIVYLIIIVVLLCRRHVRAAFAAPGYAGFEPRADQDEDERWSRPRRPENPEDDWHYR